MTQIPRAALYLGLAGLIPFVWGALTALLPPLADWGASALGSRFVAPHVGIAYGSVILAFMSGVLWGFATRAPAAEAARHYVLSVLPALWVFFTVGGGAGRATMALLLGFVALLGLDWIFARDGLAPAWWMRLRLLLTAIVVACLAATLNA